METEAVWELLRQKSHIAFLQLLEQLHFSERRMLLHHIYIHVYDMLVLVPELVERVQIHVIMAFSVDSVFELKWIDLFYLFKLLPYFSGKVLGSVFEGK